MQVIAFSGGKDSTAMALRMAERSEHGVLLFTPTGDELPDLVAHIHFVCGLTGFSLEMKSLGKTLYGMIARYNSLPNNRQRWCTRELKIQVAKVFLAQLPNPTLCVGLRADEEERQGMYGAYAAYRYPLREWGWGLKDVTRYLLARGVVVPERTDCALCYDQRLGEWYRLWRDHPDRWARGEALEAATGHTFRSPSRDTWPAAMKDLRALFEAGKVPKGGERKTLPLFEEDEPTKCRVCSL